MQEWQEWMDTGARVLVALLAGAGLMALAALTSDLLPPSGAHGALGGWPLLAALAALLCGVCALGMSVGLRVRSHGAMQVTLVALLASALAWGVCLSVAVSSANWAHALAGAPLLARTVAALASIGALVIAWLLAIAALTGLAAGLHRGDTSATLRALTPLWLTPLWGAGVGMVYGVLAAMLYTPRPSGVHFYGLDPGRWDELQAGLTLGVGAGLILGVTLALALRLTLIVRPALADHSSCMMRRGAHHSEA
jgi:hypothetical protein